MEPLIKINSSRLHRRLQELWKIGATPDGGVSRLALSETDKQARDVVHGWMKELAGKVEVDQVGNLIAMRSGTEQTPPVLLGSHLDTVNLGGRYDGSAGVLAALEVIQTLNDQGIHTRRPLYVTVFTNEEGARYNSDMLGSRAFCGELSVKEARAMKGVDGTIFGEELARIGYSGDFPCNSIKPYAYLELHIEQGPILDQEGVMIGAVESITGISWKEITIEGASNHAGTTPMRARKDAGLAAARIITFLRDMAVSVGKGQRATCGSIMFFPGTINVIPGRAVVSVDLRNSDDRVLRESESRLAVFLDDLVEKENILINVKDLARVSPSRCSLKVVEQIEQTAESLGYSHRRMISGAGHDAQIMAHTCPTAMIFVPSRGGISHSPAEYTSLDHLEAGANVLLHTACKLAG